MRIASLTIIGLVALAAAATPTPSTAKSQRTVPCTFPNGWNPADYQRQVKGFPADQAHQCRLDAKGQMIDSQGRHTN